MPRFTMFDAGARYSPATPPSGRGGKLRIRAPARCSPPASRRLPSTRMGVLDRLRRATCSTARFSVAVRSSARRTWRRCVPAARPYFGQGQQILHGAAGDAMLGIIEEEVARLQGKFLRPLLPPVNKSRRWIFLMDLLWETSFFHSGRSFSRVLINFPRVGSAKLLFFQWLELVADFQPEENNLSLTARPAGASRAG